MFRQEIAFAIPWHKKKSLSYIKQYMTEIFLIKQNGQRPFLLPTSRREIAEQFPGIKQNGQRPFLLPTFRREIAL